MNIEKVTVCDVQREGTKHIAAFPEALGWITLGDASLHVVRTPKQPCGKVHTEKH